MTDDAKSDGVASAAQKSQALQGSPTPLLKKKRAQQGSEAHFIIRLLKKLPNVALFRFCIIYGFQIASAGKKQDGTEHSELNFRKIPFYRRLKSQRSQA